MSLTRYREHESLTGAALVPILTTSRVHRSSMWASMRAALVLTAALSLACVHAPARPSADVAACVIPRVGLALASDLVGPLLMGEKNGIITVDARGCGPGVLSDADAARLSVGIVGATTGAVQLVKLSDDVCVNVWADAVGKAATDIGATLPGALAGSGVVRVEWTAPECKP